MPNVEFRRRMETRGKGLAYVRRFLVDNRIDETPMIDVSDAIPVFMKTPPEFHLKQIVATAGLKRVYEMRKSLFGSKWTEPTYSPMLTECELYMTYADYYDMMEFTEQL